MREQSTDPVMHRHVEKTNGAYREVTDRLSADTLVAAFLSGHTPESIAESFPALTLDQIYGELSFYQSHYQAHDPLLFQGEAPVDALRRNSREHDLFGYLQFRSDRNLN